jgi:hypothetical protein
MSKCGRRRRRRTHLWPLLLAACGGTESPGPPNTPTGPTGPTGPTPPARAAACGGVGGPIRSTTVTVTERGTGAPLPARAFAPAPALLTGPCPIVSLLPGGGADITSVSWAAERLAASGYVVVVTLPSSGASTAAYHLAAVSGIDFLQSTANPYRADSDTGRVGVAGWSLGARSLTRTQEEDRRVDALVAWDNLAVRESGDEGSPACTVTGTAVRTPRVPALGQASETCPGEPSDVKLRAFEHWRAAGVATMQVVFRDATHFWWGGPGTEAQRELSHAYTRAWFDRWLKADSTMTVALLGPTVPFTGAAAASVLSPRFRSAAAFDGRRCTDLRVGC